MGGRSVCVCVCGGVEDMLWLLCHDPINFPVSPHLTCDIKTFTNPGSGSHTRTRAREVSDACMLTHTRCKTHALYLTNTLTLVH